MFLFINEKQLDIWKLPFEWMGYRIDDEEIPPLYEKMSQMGVIQPGGFKFFVSRPSDKMDESKDAQAVRDDVRLPQDSLWLIGLHGNRSDFFELLFFGVLVSLGTSVLLKKGITDIPRVCEFSSQCQLELFSRKIKQVQGKSHADAWSGPRGQGFVLTGARSKKVEIVSAIGIDVQAKSEKNIIVIDRGDGSNLTRLALECGAKIVNINRL